ncbi:MAG: UDP-N-acetylglucosamine 2-epimerase (non-hydrolyzing) [Deltaproteobacteria bacterium]|nr:UDP-N-acetylglucosamine 2-epimerase (non-hydrolyzing) [Deltaproteobacteria bacterium]
MTSRETKKIAVIMGTRPEAIKLAPVIKELETAERLTPLVVSTDQHREMLLQVVETFDIGITVNLDIMQPDQSLAALSARLLQGLDSWLERAAPDMLVVQGDTTTVLIAALAAFYRRIPLAYVEAGLRTGNMYSPFPEEANRRLATPLMALYFAPTAEAHQNLLAEGIDDKRITVTGNTVIDALQMESRRQEAADIRRHIIYGQLAGVIAPDWQERPYVLITGHRRENFGAGFRQICRGLLTLAARFKDIRFIYPLHLNPNVQHPVQELMGEASNIFLIPPQGYPQFVALMKHCRLILTDSGGVQEEASSLGKPVLVMRDTTERPEGVKSGIVKLVGARADSIVRETTELLLNPAAYEKMSRRANPYGDGRASGRIVEAITRFFYES